MDAAEKVMEHARASGDSRLAARSVVAVAQGALYGPLPVSDAIAQCEAIIAGQLGDRQVESTIKCKLAQLHAMRGDFAVARELCRQARHLLRELGRGIHAAATGSDLLMIETMAGDLAAAEREARADYEYLKSVGAIYYASTLAALLSRVVRDLGRDEEAMALSLEAEQEAASEDVDGQVLWRSIRAPILARSGELAAAEELARAALEIARTTDSPGLQADALSELAAVLAIAGRSAEASKAIADAASLYEAKGDVVSARLATDQAGRFGPQ
jgi:tetratricopeptide (TPR) repeat protein